MNGVFSMNRAFCDKAHAHMGAAVLLSLATGFLVSLMRRPAQPNGGAATLNAVDFKFCRPGNLGAPFRWIPAGWRKRRAGAPPFAIAPPDGHQPYSSRGRAGCNPATEKRHSVNTLLHGAYDAMISTLKADNRVTSTRLCERPGRVSKRKCGRCSDRRSKTAATGAQAIRESTLRIEDHLQQALSLPVHPAATAPRTEGA